MIVTEYQQFLCIKSTWLYIRWYNFNSKPPFQCNFHAQIIVQVWKGRFFTLFADRMPHPNCQATYHYPGASVLVSSIPTLRDNYHSSQSPPLYLPLSAAPCVISCSHPRADKDVSQYRQTAAQSHTGCLLVGRELWPITFFSPHTFFFSLSVANES